MALELRPVHQSAFCVDPDGVIALVQPLRGSYGLDERIGFLGQLAHRFAEALLNYGITKSADSFLRINAGLASCSPCLCGWHVFPSFARLRNHNIMPHLGPDV